MTTKKAPRTSGKGPIKKSESDSVHHAVAATFHHVLSSSDFEAAKALGRPIMDVRVAKYHGDDHFHFDGLLSVGGHTDSITGTFPADWIAFLDSKRTTRGRPKQSTESKTAKNVAKLLTTQNFEAKASCGAAAGVAVIGRMSPPEDRAPGNTVVRPARISAAQTMGSRAGPDSAERKMRLDKNELLNSGALMEFDRFFGVLDRVAMCAHKTATIDVQPDGIRLIGQFWIVRIGDEHAERVEQDYFIAFPGSARATGGKINPRE